MFFIQICCSVLADNSPVDLVISEKPISICSGELAQIARRVYERKPSGYLDPADINPRPNILELRARFPGFLGHSSSKPLVEIFRITEMENVILALASEREILNLLTLRVSLAVEDNLFLENRDFVDSTLSELLKVIGTDT